MVGDIKRPRLANVSKEVNVCYDRNFTVGLK